MTAALRKFVTPWAEWMARWTDPELAPFQVPWAIGDAGPHGCIVGPFISDNLNQRAPLPLRFEIDRRFVRYPNWRDAADERKLRASDFLPMSKWLGLFPPNFVGLDRAALIQGMNRAQRQLHAGHREGYEAIVLGLFDEVVDRFRLDAEAKIQAAIDAGTYEPPPIHPALRSRLVRRDIVADKSARERFAVITGGRGGAGNA